MKKPKLLLALLALLIGAASAAGTRLPVYEQPGELLTWRR
jgi:hypothetical protein